MSAHITNRLYCILLVIYISSHFSVGAADDSKLEFETIAYPHEIILPTNEEIKSILIALKITNRSEQSLAVNKYQTPVPIIETSKGKVWTALVESDLYIEPSKNDFIIILPKHTKYIVIDASLKKSGKSYILYGKLGDGSNWELSILNGGSYKLSLQYRPDIVSVPESNLVPWVGEVTSKSSNLIMK